MEIILKNKAIFPKNVAGILTTLSQVDFFSQGLLIGSWVMLLYKKIFKINYTLRTFDIDFALETISHTSPHFVDLEKILTDLGYVVVIDYQTGLRKFTKEGLEIEFLIHRKGGREVPKVEVNYLNITAVPLPFINVLFYFPIVVDLGGFKIRIPSPEALFLHKLVIAQKRKSEAKKENDLSQCKTLSTSVDSVRMHQLLELLKFSRKTHRLISTSCEAIDFPPPF